MSGLEPFLAAAFASATAAAPAAATGTALAGAGAAGVTAGVAGAAGTVAAAGLTAAEIAAIAGGVSGVAGTGAQLLAEKPKVPNVPTTAILDDAMIEANARSDLYKRRGRAAALLTPGGAKGDTSQASLGAAALLGA